MSKSMTNSLGVINILLASFISIGSIYYIVNDFKNSKFIKNNSNSKLFLLFFLFCTLASIINGNGFQKYNNIYFVIHSSIFFYLMMLNNYNRKDYIKNLNFIIISLLGAISIIALVTIIMFTSNKLGITKNFKSDGLKDLFYIAAPIKKRWYTILLNANTYAHLVSMSFFLALIPLLTLKRKVYKLIILFMQIINFAVLILTGSKGALLSIIVGTTILIIYLFHTLHRQEEKKLFFRVVIALVILILSTFLFFFSMSEVHRTRIITFFSSQIFKIERIKSGSGRFEIWGSLLKLPLLSKPFGYSDNYIFNYMSNLNLTEFKVFSNNQGRAHNIFMQVIVSFGSGGFIIFIAALIKTFYQVLKNHFKILINNKFIFIIFLIQFIAILVGGMFEQLPIFNLSAHSLIFMFVWSNLLTLIDIKN